MTEPRTDSGPSTVSVAAPPVDDLVVARRRGLSSRLGDVVESSWRPLLLLVALVVAWWALSASGLVAPYLLPSPAQVLDELVTEWEFLAAHTSVTAYETVIGFA
ncbi:MAG TPA: hypothetical protein VIK95_11430, partial [Egibacteraceae bacterium]